MHMYTGEPFYHIPDFSSDLDIEGNDTLRVSMCVYVLNNNSYNDPYISFLLEYVENAGFYSLPSFLYEPLNEINHHEFLKNKCFEILYPIFNVNPETIEDNTIIDITARSYKGYKYVTGSKTITIGINVEDFIPFINKSNHLHVTLSQYFDNNNSLYKWAIIDEIITEKQISNSPVDPTIGTLFEKNKKIYQIRNEHKKLTEIPKMLYTYNTKNDQSADTDNLIHFEKSMSDDHGRIYLFSLKIKTDKTRFVVFPTIHYTLDGTHFYGVLSHDKFQEF